MPRPKFKERFDDFDKQMRTLYACSQRLGAYVEKLAQFRPAILPGFSEILNVSDDQIPAGTVPRDWLSKQTIATATISGVFVDICSAEWIARLRPVLAPYLAQFGLDDFDASVLKQARYRELTQRASKEVRASGYSGIRYTSRFGDEFENWALFEPWDIRAGQGKPIRADDRDLAEALHLLGIQIES